MSDNEIKSKISETLRTSERFQSGKEIKKNISNWGLRKYLPPPIQLVIFDSSVKITAQYLKENTLVNLLAEDDGNDKIVLKKKAENLIYLNNMKDNRETVNLFMSLSSKPLKIVPRCRTLRKRKVIYSRTSPSLDNFYPFDISKANNEGNQDTLLFKKVGPLKLLEELIPRTPSFFGIHNPFRIPSPKKTNIKPKDMRRKLNKVELNSKLAALKKSGVIIKNKQKLTDGQLKGEILIKKRKLDEKDIMVTVENKIKRKRGRKPKNEFEVNFHVFNINVFITYGRLTQITKLSDVE